MSKMNIELTNDECDTVMIMFALVEGKIGITADQEKTRDKFSYYKSE